MENLFAQFQGADLDRFAECIKAIRKTGLPTGRYTHAGVNQLSGNVWIWDEDWSGAVACSISFDVFWVHSCHECGEEYKFNTYGKMDEYIAKHERHCEACAQVGAPVIYVSDVEA